MSCVGHLQHEDMQAGWCPIDVGMRMMEQAEELIGHNVIGFDLPVLKKLYGFEPKCKVTDTLLCTRLIFTDVDKADYPLAEKGKLPGKMIGSHSLEAWGFRLGVLKGDFKKTGSFEKWSPEMQAYCEQDVRVTTELLKHIEAQNYSAEAIELEHRFAEIIHRMTETGFTFDVEGARKLYITLVKRREELEAELQKVFPPLTVEYETPKKKLKKSKTITFNPGSRKQIAERLISLGWKPEKTTETGQPQVDESVLEGLPYPEAKPLAEFFLIQKRIGQVAEGDNAWLKVERNGRIHGEVITNGANTGRCTHRTPNLAQVPRVGSPYGSECRGLFKPSTTRVLVGADASGLELRCLTHYLAAYDAGEYARIVCSGDVHTSNQKAFGLPEGKEYRQNAKNGIYCRIYGGSWEKLGETLGPLDPRHEQRAQQQELPDWWYENKARKEVEVTAEMERLAKRGRYASEFFDKSVPAYARLVEAVQLRYKQRKFLIGLDGRKLRPRSSHSALNTLLQSAGALIVKKATVIWAETLQPIRDQYELLAHVHDEVQAEAAPAVAERVGQAFVDAVRQAGEAWKFRCPLTGEFKIGNNWKETH